MEVIPRRDQQTKGREREATQEDPGNGETETETKKKTQDAGRERTTEYETKDERCDQLHLQTVFKMNRHNLIN